MCMKQSQLVTTTQKHPPRDEASINAQLLEQAGFVGKLMAGVYCYLPLGLRVLKNIEVIIREEMNAIGGQELLLPALQPKELWEKSGRWQGLKDVMYQFEDQAGKQVGLAVTHEEVVAEMIRRNVTSYKDLPVAVYQIQTKFRHELRPKSGVTRGREFSMKDLYSCHARQEDCDAYYERVKEAYTKTFSRMGLDALVVEASGGSFSTEYSHEFQVLTPAGEDHIYHCDSCTFAQNKEIVKVKEGDPCPACNTGKITVSRGIEVGNIFKLGTKYTEAIGAAFLTKEGSKQPVVMASYGIGVSRVLGTIVEVHHDKAGMIWPESVAPFAAHLLVLGSNDKVLKRAASLYDSLTKQGIEVLFDDRDVSPGVKLKDADLIGIPHRLVVSERTGDKVEYRKRTAEESEVVPIAEAVKRLGR